MEQNFQVRNNVEMGQFSDPGAQSRSSLSADALALLSVEDMVAGMSVNDSGCHKSCDGQCDEYYTLHTFVINRMLNAMFGCYGSRDKI